MAAAQPARGAAWEPWLLRELPAGRVLQRTRRKAGDETLLVEFWVYGSDLDGDRGQPQAVRQRVAASAVNPLPEREETSPAPDLNERGDLLQRPAPGSRVLFEREVAQTRLQLRGKVLAYGARRERGGRLRGTVSLQLDEGKLCGHFAREEGLAFVRYLSEAEPVVNDRAALALLRAARDIRGAQDEALPVGELFRAAVKHKLLPPESADGSCSLAVVLKQRPQRGAALALEVPVAGQVLQLEARPDQVSLIRGEPGCNDASLLYCLRELPLGLPLLFDLMFKKASVQNVPAVVLAHEARHFRIKLLYIEGACLLRVPRQASSYRAVAELSGPPADWKEDKVHQQLGAHALSKRGFLCAGTTVLVTPATKTPKNVRDLLERRAEHGRLAADVHEKHDSITVTFDFPQGGSIDATLQRSLIGKCIFLDTAPVPNEPEPSRRRDLAEVLDGEHAGALDEDDAARSVRIHTNVQRLPAETLWAKSAAEDDEAIHGEGASGTEEEDDDSAGSSASREA